MTNPYGHGVAIVQDPALEAEADRMGQRIADELSSGPRIGQPSMARAKNPALPARWVTTGQPGAVIPKQRVVQRALWIFGGGKGLQLQANKLVHTDPVGSGLLHGTCEQRKTYQYVQLGYKKGELNAYYLPWKNGDVTECSLKFGTPLKYFFTASLSGCSIFCKYPGDGTVLIRHEARTDKAIHQQHERQGFQLVFNSSEAEKWEFHKADLVIDESDMTVLRKTATDFVVYGVLNEDSVTFCIQERSTESSLSESGKSESTSSLVREIATTV